MQIPAIDPDLHLQHLKCSRVAFIQLHAHADHNNFFLKHFVDKGSEAASACVQTIRQLQALRNNGCQSTLHKYTA